MREQTAGALRRSGCLIRLRNPRTGNRGRLRLAAGIMSRPAGLPGQCFDIAANEFVIYRRRLELLGLADAVRELSNAGLVESSKPSIASGRKTLVDQPPVSPDGSISMADLPVHDSDQWAMRSTALGLPFMRSYHTVASEPSSSCTVEG